MTNREAFAVIKEIVLLYMQLRSRHCGKSRADEALGTIWELIENDEKYRRHDLRKNPNDLPDNDRPILFYTINFSNDFERRIWSGTFDGELFHNDDYEEYITKGWYLTSEVIWWKYI